MYSVYGLSQFTSPLRNDRRALTFCSFHFLFKSDKQLNMSELRRLLIASMQHANHIIFYMLIADAGNYVHIHTCYNHNPELSLKCLELFYKKNTLLGSPVVLSHLQRKRSDCKPFKTIKIIAFCRTLYFYLSYFMSRGNEMRSSNIGKCNACT